MEIPHTIFVAFAALLGLSLGSFGTMLIHRVPRGETLLGRSQCPHCARTLRWYDLIPVLSFFLLGGRCHACRRKISWRYPFIEATNALLFALLVSTRPLEPWWGLVLIAAATECLLLIAFYDFDTQKIPDIYIAILFLSALLYQAYQGGENPTALRGAMIGSAIPFTFFGILWIISGKRWIGSGDILLGASAGLFLGAHLTLLALFFTYVMGACAAALLILFRLAGKGSTLAFGPFLSSGTLLAFIIGEAFLAQYQTLLF